MTSLTDGLRYDFELVNQHRIAKNSKGDLRKMEGCLTLTTWNCRSWNSVIQNKTIHKPILLKQVMNPDVILLQETKAKNYHI